MLPVEGLGMAVEIKAVLTMQHTLARRKRATFCSPQPLTFQGPNSNGTEQELGTT